MKKAHDIGPWLGQGHSLGEMQSNSGLTLMYQTCQKTATENTLAYFGATEEKKVLRLDARG